MAQHEGKKDFWDKLAALTPLLLGIAVTGIGGCFTQVYNSRQLQLNQIAALDKFRPLLNSEKAEDREFGYAAFAALGYEKIAARIIQLKKDESGRSVLVELSKSGQEDVKTSAANAIRALDQAHPFTKRWEYGEGDLSESVIGQLVQGEPQLADDVKRADTWTKATSKELAIQSKLGQEILYDTVYQIGPNANAFKDVASKAVPPPLDSKDKEKAWLIEYLNQREKWLQEYVRRQPNMQRFYPSWKKRTDALRKLLNDGDWDLKTVASEKS